MPSVSVVIPTRDRASLLSLTLGSVLAQQAVGLEVVVVDEASTDGTLAMLEGLNDPRVVVLRHAVPQGVASARNAGLERATGDWIAFLDSDDLWAPDKLAAQLAAATHAGAGWAYAGAVSIDEQLRVVAAGPPPGPDAVAADLLVRNRVMAGASNVIARADLLSITGGFDNGLRHMADWDLWIRLGQHGPPAAVSRPLVAYRQHGGNASLDVQAIVAELDVIGPRYASLRGHRPIDVAQVHRWVAWSLLRADRPVAAARSYLRAFSAGDRAALPRAFAALGGRRAAERSAAARHVQDPAIAAEAERWLGALRPVTA